MHFYELAAVARKSVCMHKYSSSISFECWGINWIRTKYGMQSTNPRRPTNRRPVPPTRQQFCEVNFTVKTINCCRFWLYSRAKGIELFKLSVRVICSACRFLMMREAEGLCYRLWLICLLFAFFLFLNIQKAFQLIGFWYREPHASSVFACACAFENEN